MGKRRRRRRWPWIVSTVLVFALALSVGGLVIFKPDLLSLGAQAAPSPSAAAEAPPAPVLAAAATQAPATSRLAAQLEPLLAGTVLGNSIRVSVVDLRGGRPIFERDPGVATVPASNAKIVTAVAVLGTLGAAHRITTHAVAGPNPGEVVLVGAGDATLSAGPDGPYEGAGRLDDLADQVKKALGGTAPTKVITDGSLYQGPVLGPAWDPDAPDEGYVSNITALMIDGGRVDPKDRDAPYTMSPDPELAAGQAFARLLGVTEVTKGKAPAGAATLGEVKSAPMIRQLERVLGNSDNTLAESLARQVAVAKGKPASFDGAGEALDQVLTELQLPAGQFDMVDGSGYSRNNRLSPSVLTGVLARAADGTRPGLSDLFNALPVAGWSGSMDYRFAKPEAAGGLGVVRAKSGTLRSVNSISGIVQTVDGGLIAFAVLAENVPTWQLPAQDALDRIVAQIASCGCS
ncbi:MAG TPA: D-alanyl-D-alanine carboxypeptidase/D-alanyl-D-alanine-endopeptidase [Candidatus Limnocylindrales bacterium]